MALFNFISGNNINDLFYNTLVLIKSQGKEKTVLNAVGEEAKTFLKIPLDWQEGVRFQVDAVSGVLEADGMELGVYGYAAAANEAENTHDISSTFYMSTTNFAANDMIVFTYTGGTIMYPKANDSLRVKVIWKDASGANRATNAYFRTYTMKYV